MLVLRERQRHRGKAGDSRMVAVSYGRRTPGPATRERRHNMTPTDRAQFLKGENGFAVTCSNIRTSSLSFPTRSVSAEAPPWWRSAIGISSIRHWHRTDRLPRFHRACPSTALDERCQVREVCRPIDPKSRRASYALTSCLMNETKASPKSTVDIATSPTT